MAAVPVAQPFAGHRPGIGRVDDFHFWERFYYYGNVGGAMEEAGQNTMEWHNGDPDWNAILFYERTFRLYMKGGNEPVMWTPAHIWFGLLRRAPSPGSPSTCDPTPFRSRSC